METYLFKFSACLLVFWLVYILFLERQNMHHFKRFYLLGVLALAIVIPTLTITDYIEPIATNFETAPVLFPMELSLEKAIIEEPTIFNLENMLWLIYGFGVLLFLTRFVINLVKMKQRISKNENIYKRSFIYVLLQENIIPHSFFKYIFFSKKKYESHNIPKEVVLHEETHAKQLHSLDIIILELLQVVFWFHPLIYILKHHVKLNHEFLADQAVLNQGSDTKTYQHILLQFSSNTQDYQLSSAINYSSIKKRFTVMKTQTSQTRIWLSTLLVLPIIAALFYSFAEHVEVEKETIKTDILLNPTEPSQSANSYSQEKPIMVILINRFGELLINDELGTIESIETQLKTFKKSFDNSRAVLVKYDPSDASDKAFKEVNTLVRSYDFKVIHVDASLGMVPSPPPPKHKKTKGKGVSNIEGFESVKIQQKSHPIEINGATYYFLQKNGKTTYYDRNGKIVDINKIPPPPPVASNATTDQKAKMLAVQETYNKAQKEQGKTTQDQLTGFTEINGEKLYYVSKNGETTYYNKYGNVVKMNNLPPPPPIQSTNPSFLEYIEDMERQGASFYLDGKSITAKEAKTIANSKKGQKTDMLTQLDDNGKYVVKLSKVTTKKNILPIVNGKVIESGIITMTLNEIKELELTIPNGEITEFKFKIPGIKTESIKGNKITETILENLKSAQIGDTITIFTIKDGKGSKFTPLAIEIIE